MTISSTNTRTAPFAGNGVATVFAFMFKTYAAADLLVVTLSAAGVATILTLNSDYSVSLNADQNASPGGSITYPLSGSPLATGVTLTIVSNASDVQLTNLPNGGAFNASVINDMVDYRTVISHQNADAAGRSLRAPVTDPLTVTMTLPAVAVRASGFVSFDATGNVIIAAGISSVAINAAMVAFVQSASNAAAQAALGITTPIAATQAQQEAASSNVVAVTPGTQKFHPSAAKGWAYYNTGTTINASFNASSITDTGAGDQTVNWTTAFSSTAYAPFAMPVDQSAEAAATTFVCKTHTLAAGTTRVMSLRVSDGVRTDPSIGTCVVAFGDQ